MIVTKIYDCSSNVLLYRHDITVKVLNGSACAHNYLNIFEYYVVDDLSFSNKRKVNIDYIIRNKDNIVNLVEIWHDRTKDGDYYNYKIVPLTKLEYEFSEILDFKGVVDCREYPSELKDYVLKNASANSVMLVDSVDSHGFYTGNLNDILKYIPYHSIVQLLRHYLGSENCKLDDTYLQRISGLYINLQDKYICLCSKDILHLGFVYKWTINDMKTFKSLLVKVKMLQRKEES